MNLERLKHHFQVVDGRGLDKDTVQTLYLLIAAVMFGTVWGNVTGGLAFSGYWKKIGASDFLYGVMITLPSLANGFQFFASYLLEKIRQRKKLYLITGLIQRTIWLPFALVPLVIPVSQPALRLTSAAVFALISASMAPFMNVTFYSICQDVIPIRTRGRYFATRSRIATVVGLLIGILTGILLDAWEGMTGYIVVFVIAAIFGTIDTVCFFFMKLPPMRPAPKKAGIGKMIMTVVRDKEYMRLVIFCTVFLFGVQISSPYYNVFMQTVMRLSNLQITIYGQVISSIALVLVVTMWGRAMDTYGNKPVVFIAGILNAVYAIIWFFVGGKNVFGVILTSLITGGAWCAYDIGAQNMFLSKGGKENASMYTAVFFMFSQLLGVALGASAGGMLLDGVLYRVDALNLQVLGITLTRYNFLFLISGFIRLFAVLVLLPRVKEEGASTPREMLAGVPQAANRLRYAAHNTKIARRIVRKQLDRREGKK